MTQRTSTVRLKRIDGEHYYLPGTDLEIMQEVGLDKWDVRLGDFTRIGSFSSKSEARAWCIENASSYPEVSA